MKKIVSILLVLIMLFTLAACGQTEANKAAAPEKPAPEEPSAPSEAQEEAEEEEEEDTPDLGDAAPSQTIAPPKQLDTGTAIEETVLVDEKDVKITATGLNCTSRGAELNLVIENNSAQPLNFSDAPMGCSYVSVNGYMIDGAYLNTDVSAGKKTNETVSFGAEELMLLGITEIADITIGFEIKDEDYDTYLLAPPTRIETSAASQHDYAEDTYRSAITDPAVANALEMTVDFDAQEELFNQNGIRVCSQTMITRSDGEQALLLEIANDSEESVFISSCDLVINGPAVSTGVWSTRSVNSGKHLIVLLPITTILSTEVQKAMGIEKIGSVGVALQVSDENLETLFTSPALSVAIPGADTTVDTSGTTVYEGDGLRIVSKGIVPDDSTYNDNLHLLLWIENTTAQPLSVGDAYDSFSINGFMSDCICYSRTIASGGSAVLDVELWEHDLEENQISGIEDIQEVEMTLEIRDANYHTILEPVVSINF